MLERRTLFYLTLFLTALAYAARPEPPVPVRLRDCNQTHATVAWSAGLNPLTDPADYPTRYVVQYNTLFDPSTWHFGAEVPATVTTATVDLSPWVDYTFRVIASNEFGTSDPSHPPTSTCRTHPDRPYTNPTNLRTMGDREGYLHILWTPMPETEHNGPGFSYLLSLRPANGSSTDQPSIFPLEDWRRHEFYFRTDGQIGQPYTITIRAYNNLGYSLQDPAPVIGYPGEVGVPTRSPEGLTVVSVESTYADLQWDFPYAEINNTQNSLRGEFKGFRITYWQMGRKNGTSQVVNVSATDALANRVGDTFRYRVTGIKPQTEFVAEVAVTNTYHSSAPSAAIRFQTKPSTDPTTTKPDPTTRKPDPTTTKPDPTTTKTDPTTTRRDSTTSSRDPTSSTTQSVTVTTTTEEGGGGPSSAVGDTKVNMWGWIATMLTCLLLRS